MGRGQSLEIVIRHNINEALDVSFITRAISSIKLSSLFFSFLMNLYIIVKPSTRIFKTESKTQFLFLIQNVQSIDQILLMYTIVPL